MQSICRKGALFFLDRIASARTRIILSWRGEGGYRKIRRKPSGVPPSKIH